MDLSKLIKRQKHRPGLLGVEKIGIMYAVFTALVAIVFSSQITGLVQMLAGRAAILAGLVALIFVYRKYACRLTFFLRVAYQMALLSFWYPETYTFCQLFSNLDNVFAAVEQTLFGFQPAVAFSETFGGMFWSEMFNLGYFSYYPMIFFVALWIFFCHYKNFEKATFIIVSSFLIYYLVFLFLPVAGPQYYYQAVGLDAIRAGEFPALGDYFRHHTDMLPTVQHGGLFQWLVEKAQEGGERPTAAFPSSHVGMSTILLILTYKVRRKMLLPLLPFYVLLCCATVYIQAHYLIDAIAGFVSAFVVYTLAHKLYYTKTFHRKRGFRV